MYIPLPKTKLHLRHRLPRRSATLLHPPRRSAALLHFPADPRPYSIFPADPWPSSVLSIDPRPSSILPADPRPSSVLPTDPRPSSVFPAISAALRRRSGMVHAFVEYETVEDAERALNIVDGKMQYLFDEDGHRYLDAFARITTVCCGHCHPEVVEVIINQAYACNILLFYIKITLLQVLRRHLPPNFLVISRLFSLQILVLRRMNLP